MALHPCPCTSHKSRTAGMAAQYVPRNGTAPRIAANARAHRSRDEKKIKKTYFTSVFTDKFWHICHTAVLLLSTFLKKPLNKCHIKLLVFYGCGLGEKKKKITLLPIQKSFTVSQKWYQFRRTYSYTDHAHFKLLHNYKLATVCKKMCKQESHCNPRTLLQSAIIM